MRKNIATLFAAASMAVAGISLTGCKNDNNKDPDMTGATHGGVRTGEGSANPSGSPSLSGARMGGSGTYQGTSGMSGTGATGTGATGTGATGSMGTGGETARGVRRSRAASG